MSSPKFGWARAKKLPLRYPYFEVVVGLAWSYDPESYAGGSIAAGTVSHAGQ
jgi:hypothetical protein